MHARPKRSAKPLLEQYARQNRFAPTESEQALWRALSAKKLGVTFRRQVVVGGKFIADFFAPAIRLCVEVDGECHARRRAADARRDRFLQRRGYRVLRLDAELVMKNLTAAVAAVRVALGQG